MAHSKIKPAANLVDLWNRLEEKDALKLEDKDFYIPIFDAIITEELRIKLLQGQHPTKSYYLIGQVGTGKTTALNFLPDEEINARFHIVHPDPNNYVDSYFLKEEPVYIADILMCTAYELLQGAEELTLKFVKKINNIYAEIKGNRVQITENAENILDGFFKEAIRIFTKFRTDSFYRKYFRETFRHKTIDLIQVFNTIITNYEEQVLKGERELLLIIDGWEKIRNRESLTRIFNNGMSDLDKLKVRKIVIIPPIVADLPHYNNEFNQTKNFILKVKSNPFEAANSEEEQNLTANKDKLKDLIWKRVQDPSLIQTEALELGIQYSGGIIRQFMALMAAATFRAFVSSSSIVRPEHVEAAFREQSANMKMGVTLNPQRRKVLEEVYHHHSYKSQDENNQSVFIECVQSNFIIFNKNGDVCYWVNPLVEDLFSNPK